MDEATLLKKQIATARIILFIIAADTAIAAILLLPQDTIPLVKWMDILITLLVALIYLLLGLWTKRKPYTAFLVGFGIALALILAGVIAQGPGLAGHWPSRVITILLFLLGLGDSRDAQRKMSV